MYYIPGFWFCIFMGFLCVQMCIFHNLYVFPLVLFTLFILSFLVCSILSYLIIIIIFICLFSSTGRERKGTELGGWGGGEDLGVVGGGETVIRIYCIKNLFLTK